MTKNDIVDRVVENTGFSKKVGAEMVEGILAIVKTTLESGENLKIAGFGNFTVKTKAIRRGRNPQTGEELTISSRRILSFKPSVLLKKAINS